MPADSTGSYGIFSRDTRNGSWVLADWYPILAVYEEGDGWALPEATSFGDPTYAPSAFYDVRVTAPDDLEVVATGVVTAETDEDGTIIRRLRRRTGARFRDRRRRRPRAAQPGGRRHAADALDRAHARPAISEQTLDTAADACATTTTASAPTRRGRSIWCRPTPPARSASPGRGSSFSTARRCSGPTATTIRKGWRTVVAHEVAHLWWGILVGGDSNKHGYIQEGLATVSSLLYLNETLGPEAAGGAARSLGDRTRAGSCWRRGTPSSMCRSPRGMDENIRSAATYGKGSLGFLAIRQEIGAEAFEAALHDIATRYAWGEMTPEQLREAFERASGQDLAALWSHWFDEAAMTREEIEEIAAAFGGQR